MNVFGLPLFFEESDSTTVSSNIQTIKHNHHIIRKSMNYYPIILTIIIFIVLISIGTMLFIYFKRNEILNDYIKMAKRSARFTRYPMKTTHKIDTTGSKSPTSTIYSALRSAFLSAEESST
ncbi:hypothetical protein DERP_004126 [Dermatophagoides pteronyssinus]|uniref:Uncharacterized protein n=1 Tax=Dermatophagoides pteronyssinus TaxID=6956 RepID=A0ABQ8J8Q9_DERPT|nr:hypothetical protein DERP_004126 [Dermatophagoides pteronyssinus]